MTDVSPDSAWAVLRRTAPTADEPSPEAELLGRLALSWSRALPGTAILDVPAAPVAVWGDGEQVLHAAGEPFLLVGPDGTGKTSLAQQYALRRCGIRTGPLLGFPVAEGQERTLYLACDRPAQALRSFGRMVTDADRAGLADRLVIWNGPLPFDLVNDPQGLLLLAQESHADTIVIDSLKDVAPRLTDDETGQQVNAALQWCVSSDVEVLALHHQRKAQAGAGKPRAIADVYGSRWITAGCGSIVMLWGDAGDLIVELDHIKQPAETVGPFRVLHDHAAGASTVEGHVDAWSVLASAAQGASATGTAATIFATTTPDRNQTEKARRQLERLVKEGRAHKRPGVKGGPGGGDSALYFIVAGAREEAR